MAEPVVGSIIFEDEPEKPIKPKRDYAAELDELKAYIKELQDNVIWLKKAIKTHGHTFMDEADINATIMYEPEQPVDEYDY